MKCVFLFLAIFFSALIASAQTQLVATDKGKGRISGKIMDSVSRIAIEYATITIYQSGNPKPVNGTTAANTGSFTLDALAPGIYTLKIDFIGYQSRSIGPFRIEGKSPALFLGNIFLSKRGEALQAVTVTASKGLVENKIDRLVYNAEKDITSQGGVATDILKKVPMVSVDVDGNVDVQGNTNILFLINGKPSSIFGNNLTDALQSIPASQIKSIEVITSPGAKYDAEGTGGIINIVLKDAKIKGINGNISLTGGSRLQNGSLNLNARKNNFGINAFFSGNAQLSSTTINSSDRISTDTSTHTTNRLLQNGKSKFTRNGYQSGLGFEWNVDHKNTISGTFGYDNFGNNSNGYFNQEQMQYGQYPGNPSTDFLSLTNTENHFRAQSVDWNLNYKKTFAQEDRELDISYDGSYGKNNSNYAQRQSLPSGDSLFAGSHSNSTGNDKETNFRLDYTQPLSDKVKLETGARLQIRQITNVSDVYNLDVSSGAYLNDTAQSNSLNYTRHVYAGYGSLSFPLLNFLDVKGGLRYERTETNADFSKTAGTAIPGYNIFAPSLILSHKFTGEQTLKVSYTKRIQRPNYRSLNPFVNASDPKNLVRGNPYLQPEIEHSIDLTYSKSFDKGSALNVVLFYHRSDQDIQPFIVYYPSFTLGDSVYTNVSVSTQVNVGSENNYGLSMYGSVPFGNKLTVRGNFSLFDRYITTGNTSTTTNTSITSFNYRMNMNATYQLNPSFVLEFFGDFRSPRNEIQGKYPSFTSYNFAFRKQIWNKKGSIAFTTTNPFANYVKQELAVTGQNFTMNSIRQIPYRSFGINFTYKFGKLEFRKDKEKEENANAADTKDN